jgi:hypothetical protein
MAKHVLIVFKLLGWLPKSEAACASLYSLTQPATDTAQKPDVNS